MPRRKRSIVTVCVLGAALAVLLILGSRQSGPPPTPVERANHLSERVKCPTCVGQSVAESRAGAARAVYAEILRRTRAGQSDQEILGYVASRYGKAQLLLPESSGAASLLWILPVVGLAAAFFVLGLAFRRWRTTARTTPTDEDRRMVDLARSASANQPVSAGESE